MQLVRPGFEFIDAPDGEAILQKLELAARTCYKSEGKIREGSAERLIRSCIQRGHESVLEHVSVTVRVVCDRGVSHELVRHRLASYSQESTRYCNYADGIAVIAPCFFRREWRHFFRLRTSRVAHPQIREIAVPMLCAFRSRIPVVFEDIVLES